MRHSLLAAAAAHALLFLLLYVASDTAKPEEVQAREREDRQRYDALRTEAVTRRSLEQLARSRDAGAVPTAEAGDGPPGAGAPPGRRDRFAGGPRGPAVRQNVDEYAVRAEWTSARPTPGRVFVGWPAQASWSFVDSWYTIGPFPEGSAAHPPERSIDLDAKYVGAAGALVSWRFLQSARPEVIPATMTPHSVHYAYTKLRSDRKREAWLVLGADDAMKVWLNGEPVWDCGDHWRPWAPDEGARRVTLLEGYNTVLVRLDNWPDHGAFSVVVRTSAPE
jgi:hypothetical protein